MFPNTFASNLFIHERRNICISRKLLFFENFTSLELEIQLNNYLLNI